MATTEKQVHSLITNASTNETKESTEELEMKSVDENDSKYVVYQSPETPVTPLIVRIGLTVYEMGAFDVANGVVPVVFDLWLTYDKNIYESTFGSTRDVLPWIMPNALELDVAVSGLYHMYGTDLDSLNIFTKRQKFEKNAELKSFTVEMYTCRSLLKLTTFPSEDPFQSIYLVFKLAMDGTPGSEMTQFKAHKNACYFPGIRSKIADFSKGETTMREFRVSAEYGEYSRLYFIFEYKKSPLEDLAKYYLLPALINGLTIGFYDTVDSLFESAGAYFLAIIALLFTLPETGAFTRNEKAVVIGSIWMLTILLVLISSPSFTTQIVLWCLLGSCYFILIVYDIIASSKLNGKYRHVLFDGDLSTLDAI